MPVAEHKKPARTPSDAAATPNGAVRSVRVATAVLALAVLACYWPVFRDLWRAWSEQPDYSHGFLVPAFAAVILWARRAKLDVHQLNSSWWGVPLLVLAAVLHLTSTYLCLYSLRPFALLPCLAGVAMICGGWSLLGWCWPAILFLSFMMPLPPRISGASAFPLQRISTISSTYMLNVLGLPAVSEGNVIHLNRDVQIGVVEACSGLRMLILFFAISTWVAVMAARRPTWERWLIVASAAPIALMSNVVRLTASGAIYNAMGQAQGDRFFHAAGGILMGPTAVVLLALELKLLNAMFESDKGATGARERRAAFGG